MLDFNTFNLSKCNISCKNTFLNVGPKLFYLGWKSKKLLYCSILHQLLQDFPNTKFRPKIKILKCGTIIALIRYFWLEFQNTNVVFEIGILEFVNTQSFIQKPKPFKLGTKSTLFRYFWAAIL